MTRDPIRPDESAAARDGTTVVAPPSVSPTSLAPTSLAPTGAPPIADVRRIGHVLDRALSRMALLALRTRLARWSVVEPELWGLRDVLDDRHAQLDADVDAIADRMRQLGVFPGGAVDSWQELVASADGAAYDASTVDLLEELVAEDDRTLRALRAAQARIPADDAITSALLARLEHDLATMRWSLRTLCDAMFSTPHAIVLEQVA